MADEAEIVQKPHWIQKKQANSIINGSEMTLLVMRVFGTLQLFGVLIYAGITEERYFGSFYHDLCLLQTALAFAMLMMLSVYTIWPHYVYSAIDYLALRIYGSVANMAASIGRAQPYTTSMLADEIMELNRLLSENLFELTYSFNLFNMLTFAVMLRPSLGKMPLIFESVEEASTVVSLATILPLLLCLVDMIVNNISTEGSLKHEPAYQYFVPNDLLSMWPGSFLYPLGFMLINLIVYSFDPTWPHLIPVLDWSRMDLDNPKLSNILTFFIILFIHFGLHQAVISVNYTKVYKIMKLEGLYK